MKSCIGCEVAEATVAAICAACDHLVCNAFELAEKQMLVSLPSLAASPGDIYEMQAAAAADFYGDEENQQSIPLPSLTATSSVYKENEETEAVTAFVAPLALLTESPGNIYKEVLEEPARPARSGSGSKRSRAAEVHNLSEKRRRSRINEKMKALQNLIPNSNKLSIPLPSLTATSSVYKENEETEAVTAFVAPLALLTESPGNIYKDPKEKAKSETRDWLNNLVTDLESQIDNFEAEADGLTVKKGKTRPARLTHLETSISRHKAHIVKLEVVFRLLDNDGLSPDQVNDIKDFLEDYVERNQENFDEFDNADELYSSLPLDQELEELAALGPTLVKAALSATTQKTIVQDQSEEPSPQDTNSVISPRIPPSKSGTMGSLVSAPLSSVGCGTPSGSSSAVTANILVRPLVGGPSAASTISGPVTVQGFVENSAAAVSSSLLNSSNLVKDDDATFPTRKCSPAIPEIGLGRGIGRGISSQVSVGLPMSLGSVGGIDGNVALGSATPVSDTAKRNMLNVDERVGAGVSQTLVSPLSNRILLQQASKDTEGTASNDSNNVCEGVVGGRVFPSSVVTGVQWKHQSLSPYQNQNETGQFRGRPDITPDQREKFLERFEQIEQVTQQGHSSLLTVPHLSGANYKQFSPQQQNLSLQQFLELGQCFIC